MAKNSANKLMKEMQQIAANAQVEVQRLANEATQKSFDYNAKEANTARTWQKEMSDTAHQREVADLKKAGLNPVLSANSGAQSYTTSSASAQANDPSGSVAGLASELMSSRTGAYQADVSAKATRAAAAKTAAATKAAAAQAASAQRFAASMQYAASIYHSNKAKAASDFRARMDYRSKKYGTDKNKTASLYGVLSNGLDSFGNGLTAIGKGQLKSINNVLKKPENYLKDASKGFKASNLNVAGRQFVNKQLRKWNVGTNDKVYKLYVNAFMRQDKSAMKKWTNYVANVYRLRKIASQNVINKNSLYW